LESCEALSLANSSELQREMGLTAWVRFNRHEFRNRKALTALEHGQIVITPVFVQVLHRGSGLGHHAAQWQPDALRGLFRACGRRILSDSLPFT